MQIHVAFLGNYFKPMSAIDLLFCGHKILDNRTCDLSSVSLAYLNLPELQAVTVWTAFHFIKTCKSLHNPACILVCDVCQYNVPMKSVHLEDQPHAHTHPTHTKYTERILTSRIGRSLSCIVADLHL